jgi:predicted nucleic acid-binding protein
MDMTIAARALVHNLTLATHNIQDYANVSGLRLVDWLAP